MEGFDELVAEVARLEKSYDAVLAQSCMDRVKELSL
jgi:hypothetical protein